MGNFVFDFPVKNSNIFSHNGKIVVFIHTDEQYTNYDYDMLESKLSIFFGDDVLLIATFSFEVDVDDISSVMGDTNE